MDSGAAHRTPVGGVGCDGKGTVTRARGIAFTSRDAGAAPDRVSPVRRGNEGGSRGQDPSLGGWVFCC